MDRNDEFEPAIEVDTRPDDRLDSGRENGDLGNDPYSERRSLSPGPRRESGHDRPPSPGFRRDRSRSPYDRRNMSRSDAANPGNNLFVSGLSARTDEQNLEELFSKYGKVVKCQVMRDPHTNDHRGFAFVTMDSPEGAERCKETLHSTELHGRTIGVETAKRGRPRTPTPGRYQGGPKTGRQYFAYDVTDRRDRGYGRGGRDYDRGGRGYDRGGRDYDRGGRDYDRGGRDYDRGGRDYERGGRDYDRGGRDYDRGGRDYDRGGRDYDRGGRDYGRH